MQAISPGTAPESSVSPDEIARFGALAAHWWDPDGPMRPLHRMNRLRVRWIDRRLAYLTRTAPTRLRLLDLGCGAGLASEALAALGHDVLGVDASAEAIAAAQEHQTQPFAALAYRCASAETLIAEGQAFDAVIALEIIEHVPDPAAFIQLLGQLVAPGGMVFVSTLNRTWRSFAVAKIGAEYLLRMLPAGTHQWRKFVTPAELGHYASAAGLRVSDLAGMVPGPGGWRESPDSAVNYIASIESR